MRIEVEGGVAAADAAWELIGDSDHLGRTGGFPPLTFTVVPAEDGLPVARGRMLGPAGIRHSFEDQEQRWRVGERLHISRSISGPALRSMTFTAWLKPSGAPPDPLSNKAGVRPVLSLEVLPVTTLLEPVLRLALAGLGRQWSAALAELPPPQGQHHPRPVLRRLDHSIETAFRRWRDRGVPPELSGQLRRLLTTARAWEVRALRPFALADAWDTDREAALAWFIEATAAGLLEMVHAVRCPRCGEVIRRMLSLSGLRDEEACPTCRISVAVDLSSNVEVLFAAPAYLGLQPAEHHCTLYPARRADLTFVEVLPGRGEARVTVELEAGHYRLVPTRPEGAIEITVSADASADTVAWRTGDPDGAVTVRPGPVTFELDNPRAQRVRIALRHLCATAAWVSGARLVTFPAFRQGFGPPTLGAGVRLQVSHLAVLFTDLIDTTSFFSEEGDRRALEFVRAHYDALSTVVEDCGGTTVKLVGDSLMASFVDTVRALEAAVRMQERFARWATSQEVTHVPRLRIGVNAGSALAVHTPGAGLDYFGGMINLANRAVQIAAGGEVIWPDVLDDLPGVAEWLTEHDEAERFEMPARGEGPAVMMRRIRVGLSGAASRSWAPTASGLAHGQP